MILDQISLWHELSVYVACAIKNVIFICILRSLLMIIAAKNLILLVIPVFGNEW